MADIRRTSILEDVQVFAYAHVMLCRPAAAGTPAKLQRDFLPLAVSICGLTPPAIRRDIVENDTVWHCNGKHLRDVVLAGSRRSHLVKVIGDDLHAAFERIEGRDSLSISEAINEPVPFPSRTIGKTEYQR